MYCQKCGDALSDQDKFCKKCGAPVSVQANVQQTASPSAPVKSSSGELAELDRMISYFGQIQSQFDEYDQSIANIRFISDPKNKVKVKKGIPGLPFIIAGAVLAPEFLAFLAMCLFAYAWVSADTPGHQLDNGAAALMFSIAIIGTLISIAAIVFGIIMNVKRKKRYAEGRKAMIRQNCDRACMLSNVLTASYNNFGPCQVSSLYSNPRILLKLREIIASGKAVTVNDAVDILHQYSGVSAALLQSNMPIQPVAFYTADSFS